jgi:hypothetical protein
MPDDGHSKSPITRKPGPTRDPVARRAVATLRARRGLAVLAGVPVAAACVVALLPGSGQAAASKTETLRFFDKPISMTVTKPDGTVLRPPLPEAQPGDVLDVYSLDYKGNHRKHARRWSMSGHLRCVFAMGPPDCVSHVARRSSLLIFHGDKLVAGTGRYQGATGRVLSNKEIGNSNASDVVARVRRR